MDTLNFAFPLQKINKEKRIVTGIATANNPDWDGEIVDFNASVDAFANWVGNIREMHDPKTSVGKVLDWRPTQIFHKGQVYDAIEVDVYISKGAESTWLKILDGTLKGFSIGGRVEDHEMMMDEAAGTYRKVITKYSLGELSVVDNPNNPAGLFTIIKVNANGELEMVDDKKEIPVYYCSIHKCAIIDDNKYCPTCSGEMDRIGFVESFDVEVIQKMIEDYDLKTKGEVSEVIDLHEKENDDMIKSTMNDFTDEQKATVGQKLADLLFGKAPVEDQPSVVVPNVTINIEKGILIDPEDKEEAKEEVEVVEEVKEEIEKSATVADEEESKEDNVDIEELLKGVGSLLDEKLATVKEEIAAEVDSKIEAIEKSVADHKEETAESLTKTGEEIEKVANSGAIQKSVDVEEVADEDKIEKSVNESFWGGIFVPKEVVNALGYES